MIISMCKRVLSAIAIAAIFNAGYASAASLRLGKGQQEAINFDSMATSVSVAQVGIVDVVKGETKSVILVTGKSEGSTGITVKLEDGRTVTYDVTVSGNSKGSFSGVIGKLRKATGVTVEQQGSKYLVSGQFRNRSDQLLLQNAVRSYPGLILDTTDPEIAESNAVVKAVNRVLADNDIANLQAHAYGPILALEGSPKDEMQKTLALRIARTIAPGIEDHVATDSNGAPSIVIEVLFIESSKTNNKSYGMHGLQEGFAGRPVTGTGGVATGKMDSFSAQRYTGNFNLNWQVGGLMAFLKMEQTKTSARLVSNPKLVTRSGQKATFESGGQFFISSDVIDPDGKTVKRTYTPQQTGITLSIEPRIDQIGQIDSKIKTTISEVGEKSDTAGAPPSLIKSNLETAVTIPNGQSILLSGLTFKRANKTTNRVPLLADIPIIGELFKERVQEFKDKEVAVIVTMKRVIPTEDRAQVSEQLLDTSENDVSFSFFD
jgi:Flp pilus assembly secretin CpaC